MVELSPRSDASRVPPASLETHLRIPLGAFSPLWFVYAGAASAGAAAWWMTRWMQPVNLEAVWGGAAPALAASDTMTPEPAPPPAEASVPTLAAPAKAEAPAAAPAESPAPEPPPPAVKAAAPSLPAAPKPKTANRSRSGASERKGGPSPAD